MASLQTSTPPSCLRLPVPSLPNRVKRSPTTGEMMNVFLIFNDKFDRLVDDTKGLGVFWFFFLEDI